MINLLMLGVSEQGFLNRQLVEKIIRTARVDNASFIISFRDQLEYYQDLGTCYVKDDIARGIYTDEQLELDKCVPLEDDIFDYMNPYVIEILNQQRRYEQGYGCRVSNTWESHYIIFMHNLFFWNSMLENKEITHVLFSNIPHEGYPSIIYHLCKKKNIQVIILYESLIPNRERVITDYMKLDEDVKEEFERLKLRYRDAAIEEIELEGDTKEAFENWASLNPVKMTPAYMRGDKLRNTFRARYGETNLIRVWRGILGKEYEKYGINVKFLCASIGRIPRLFQVIPDTYQRWSYARPYWKETKKVNVYYEENSTIPIEGEEYIYYALHYQPELTSNPLGGGAYCDQMFSLQILSRSIPEEMHIYVKANPAQLSFFGGIQYYEEIKKLPKVRLMKLECSTYDLMKNAVAVASLTGTACWECQFYGVPAILFGYSSKNASPLAYHVRTVKECETAINDIIKRDKRTDVLKELKLFIKAAHNISYHINEREKNVLELFKQLANN